MQEKTTDTDGMLIDSESKYQSLFNNMFDEVHYWELVRDENGNIKTWRLLDINPAAEQSWGKKRKDVIGKTTEEIFSTSARDLFLPVVNKIFSEDTPYSWETYFPDLDQYLKMTSVPFGNYFISTGVNITDLKKAKKQAEEKEESLRLVLDMSEMGFWDHDIPTNTLTRSAKHDQLFGYKEMLSEWNYETFIGHVFEEDRQIVERTYKKSLASGGDYDVEFRTQWPNKSIHWLWCKGKFIRDENGQVIRAAGILADITAKKYAEQEIARLAYKDDLTNLPNKKAFFDQLKKTISETARREEYAALLFLDIDDFKKINDTLGHDVGDKVLKHVASLLEQHLREVDTVARFGGDEFVIIISSLGHDPDKAKLNLARVYQKIESLFAQEMEVAGQSLSIRHSIGVRLFSGKNETIGDILKHADLAMYKAKEGGKNAIRYFDAIMEKEFAEKVELENELRRAIDEEQLFLVYQPKLNRRQEPVGFEALIRWKHPKKGLIPPDVFIPIAEETGLIIRLGKWVMDEAFETLKIWQQKFNQSQIELSINISPVQFSHSDFLSSVESLVSDVQLDASKLIFEITEQSLLYDIGSTQELMKRTRCLGINFSLDDFGTGYSSLYYLKNLPISEVKIDKSFIRDILIDKNDAAIVEAIASIADKLSLKLVAEGVETEEQFSYLENLGCNLYQGYLFSKPLLLNDAISYLEMNTCNPK